MFPRYIFVKKLFKVTEKEEGYWYAEGLSSTSYRSIAPHHQHVITFGYFTIRVEKNYSRTSL